MSWPKLLWVLAPLLVGFSLGGCIGIGRLLAPLAGKSPYTDGTWTGRLVSLTVRDKPGREYQAAALQIESGPRKFQSGYTGTGAIRIVGDVALLSEAGVAVTDPNDLGLSPGTRVRVKGRMMMGSTIVLAEEIHDGAGIIEPVSSQPVWQPGSELLIRMRGKPKVLPN